MKDLLVITADTDTQVVMQAVLNRGPSLGICKLTFDVRRHDGRDSGVFRDGPELVRHDKPHYSKLLLLWDHHGSGRDGRLSPEECSGDVQARLDSVSWKGRSAATVLVPELEEWLWHNPSAIETWLQQTETNLKAWQEEFAGAQGQTLSELQQIHPKELLQFVCRKAFRRLPVPRDYETIARKASLSAWRRSPSFDRIATTLQSWFPGSNSETSLAAG